MPKPGDKVLVNGVLMTLLSWPSSGEGPFHAEYTNPQGGLVQGTYWTGMITEEVAPEFAGTNQVGPVYSEANVQVVQEGELQNTLGDVTDIVAEVQAAEHELGLDDDEPTSVEDDPANDVDPTALASPSESLQAQPTEEAAAEEPAQS